MAALSDISTVIGAVGGGAVVAVVGKELFAFYSIGLAIGFFLYFIVGLAVYGKEAAGPWMGNMGD